MAKFWKWFLSREVKSVTENFHLSEKLSAPLFLRKLVLGIPAQASGKNHVAINAFGAPIRPAFVSLRHIIASSILTPWHYLKWLDGVSDVIPDPLWRYARRVPRITYAYRGLPALASLSMAGSVRDDIIKLIETFARNTTNQQNNWLSIGLIR